MSFVHPLVHVNWAYCLGCSLGEHAQHVPDDEEEGPCACACAGGPAPKRSPPPPEPLREIDEWRDDPWTEPEPEVG